MATLEKETPPAATEGVDYNSAGEQEQATVVPVDVQHLAEPLDPPRGLVGELAAYFYKSARYPMKEGALLAALGLMAGVAGRNFNFDGTGLNLYLLLLAESGRGKEDMRSGIDRLLSAVRPNVSLVDEFIGPDTFASGQGLVRALDRNKVFLSIQSEFGLRVKQFNHPHASEAMVMLKRVLLDLYAKSGWNNVLRPTVYSDSEKNTRLIQAPCVSILGESTPGHVYDNLSFRDIEDGLLPRCLILECNDKRPRANPAAGAPPPPQLAQQFAALVATCLTMGANNTVAQIAVTPDAAVALQAVQDWLDDAYNATSREAHERALWNRAALNIRRIAALIAIGCMPANGAPIIEKDHVDWAEDFVEHCINGLAEKFREGVVGTGEARLEAELKKYVREYLSLGPARRRVYKVPHKLTETDGCIGLDYLRRRAKRCAAFTQDRRGFDRALADTVSALCRTGALFKLSPVEVYNRFGLRGEVYGLGDVGTFE
jgi:hypothetical protein